MPTRDLTRRRWFMPAFCLLLGALMFGAFALGGNLGQGVFSFGVMAVLAAIVVFGGRSETLQGLSGPARDERFEMIDLRATAFTGAVLIACIIGGFLYEVARGHDARPWSLLGLIGGVAYVLAIAVLRKRS